MKKVLLQSAVALYAAVFLIASPVSAQKSQFQFMTTNGVGFSVAGAVVKIVENNLPYVQNFDINSGVAFSSMNDFGLSPHFSIGFGYFRQTFSGGFTGYVNVYNDTIGGTFHAKVARENYGLRLLGHWGKSDKMDWYAGLRIGYTKWTFNTDAQNFQLKKASFGIPFLPQAVVGFRYMPVPFAGITVETGIGPPYFFAAGATIAVGGGTWKNWRK